MNFYVDSIKNFEYDSWDPNDVDEIRLIDLRPQRFTKNGPTTLHAGTVALDLKNLQGLKKVRLPQYHHKIIFQIVDNALAEIRIEGKIQIRTGAARHEKW